MGAQEEILPPTPTPRLELPGAPPQSLQGCRQQWWGALGCIRVTKITS